MADSQELRAETSVRQASKAVQADRVSKLVGRSDQAASQLGHSRQAGTHCREDQ
jgi:hypothetical protein